MTDKGDPKRSTFDQNGTSEEIQPNKIYAAASIYFAFQLDQMWFFEVVDRVIEQFIAGLLPIGDDDGARKLDAYHQDSEGRMSKDERLSAYSRVLGAADGQVSQDVNPNTKFNTHLMRFLSSVAEFESQHSIGNLVEDRTRTGHVPTTTADFIREAGRDLVANISLFGGEGIYFAAERLSEQVERAMEILQLPRVREAYTVNSMWKVIERVGQRELGVSVNVVKHRTLAEETKKILHLIADKHTIWTVSSDRELFTKQPDAPVGDLTYEESQSLLRSVENWLAVSEIQDEMGRFD